MDPTPSAAMIQVQADLHFSVRPPSRRNTDSGEVSGFISAEGQTLRLLLGHPLKVSMPRKGRLVRQIARALATQGLVLEVADAEGTLVQLGSVRSNFLFRLLTGSAHIRPRRLDSVWSMLLPVSGADRSAVQLTDLIPPATLLPLAPTLGNASRRISTTHDPESGGRPRLLFTSTPLTPRGDGLLFYLTAGVTTIGSSPDSDLLLEGLDARHAEIRRDENDEYVVVARGVSGTRVNGAPVTTQLLRTGTRIEMGGWAMSYYREEYADHGRPYGGRIGGELGFQRPQPKPSYEDPAEQ